MLLISDYFLLLPARTPHVCSGCSQVTFVMQLTALALLTLGLLIQRNWEGLVALFESKKARVFPAHKRHEQQTAAEVQFEQRLNRSPHGFRLLLPAQVADVAVRDTFSSTVEDHLLRGQDSYNLDENPEYAEAMGHLGGETSHPATTAFLDSVRLVRSSGASACSKAGCGPVPWVILACCAGEQGLLTRIYTAATMLFACSHWRRRRSSQEQGSGTTTRAAVEEQRRLWRPCDVLLSNTKSRSPPPDRRN